MLKDKYTPLFDMVVGLSNALDLADPVLVNHHKEVAYIAVRIAANAGLSKDEQNDILLAGLLHDIGCFSLKSRLDLLDPAVTERTGHAETGYQLLKDFAPFAKIATLIRYHDVPWNDSEGDEFDGNEVPIGSHILNLADRIGVLISKQKNILGQVKLVCEQIQKLTQKQFVPNLVDIFMSLSTKEYIWLDVTSSSLDSILANRAKSVPIELDSANLVGLAKLFCQVIDFRSRFTATHTSGVAASAVSLSKFFGFSEEERIEMQVAGYLHDLGKLSIPVEILEKPAKLTEDEFNVIKTHTFNGYRVLENIEGFGIINEWASFHHERLDGKGYPFHLKSENLILGSKIMAVADVFTAITEDRPYRSGMQKDKALQVLQEMTDNSALDSLIVSALKSNYDEVSSIRRNAQMEALEKYQRFESHIV